MGESLHIRSRVLRGDQVRVQNDHHAMVRMSNQGKVLKDHGNLRVKHPTEDILIDQEMNLKTLHLKGRKVLENIPHHMRDAGEDLSHPKTITEMSSRLNHPNTIAQDPDRPVTKTSQDGTVSMRWRSTGTTDNTTTDTVMPSSPTLPPQNPPRSSLGGALRESILENIMMTAETETKDSAVRRTG